ncbi:aldo/keto reductase [Nonomuraea sp. B12E4]|uniref:aldo/keto reductase n=1 Tax=Nonomuraea sp. B12E4 TaxID=3153564 RepID=UPI00325DC5B7
MGGTPFVCLQPQYSLLARTIEAEILPTCARHGLGVMTWSPLGSGLLTGRYKPADMQPDSRLGRLLASPVPMANKWAQDLLTERNLRIVEEARRVAADLGTTTPAVALAWLSGRPGVTSVILGPRTLRHLEENLEALELKLPAELARRLDEISSPSNDPVNGMSPA